MGTEAATDDLNPNRWERHCEMENMDIFLVAQFAQVNERARTHMKMNYGAEREKNVQPKTDPPARYESY